MRTQWVMTAVAAVALGLPVASLAAAPAAPADSPSGPGGIRIAYVDLDRVARDSQMVTKRVKNVEEHLAGKQETLKAKMKERNQLRSQLTQQDSVLTAAQTEQLRSKIKTLQDEIDFLTYQMNKAVSDTSRDVIEPVLDQVLESVERVAKASKVDLVLRGDLILFASERVDLTDWVIRDLDQTLPATETKASPAQGPARRSPEPSPPKPTPSKPGAGK